MGGETSSSSTSSSSLPLPKKTNMKTVTTLYWSKEETEKLISGIRRKNKYHIKL